MMRTFGYSCVPYRFIKRVVRCLSVEASAIPKQKKTIAVAMSGGIDSAVSALLLQDQGYDIVGVFMKNWDAADECGSQTCDLDSDQKDMQEVCDRLGIPAYEVNFVKEYWNEVFSPFLDAYQAGVETPNPDAFCNRHVKFKHLLKFVNEKLKIDTIATGHYSRISPKKSVPDAGLGCGGGNESECAVQLLRGLDPLKDQSYFLSLTKGTALEKVMLPIGHLMKSEVKQIAASRLQGLRILTKPESMGICFIGKRDMREFLEEYITLTPGRFIDLDTGDVVGKHSGFEYYTIGQKARISGTLHKYYVVGRKKNYISAQNTELNAKGGRSVSSDGVTDIDMEHKEVDQMCADYALSEAEVPEISGDIYVVLGTDHPSMTTPYIIQSSESINWIRGRAPAAFQAMLQGHDRNSNHIKSGSDRSSGSSGGSSGGGEGNGEGRFYRCECKCRYSQLPTPCTIQLIPPESPQAQLQLQSNTKLDGEGYMSRATAPSSLISPVLLKIVFDIPQRAITPGQIVALYDGEVCLGGAVLEVQPVFKGKDKQAVYL